MGDDPFAHGLERNRATMAIFCDMGHRLGLTEKRVTVDDYFGEFTAGYRDAGCASRQWARA